MDDVWVLRLDANGNVKWQKTYGGSDHDKARAVAVAKNGDIIVAGETDSFGAGLDDVWVLRLPSSGELEGFSRDSTAMVIQTNAKIAETNAKITGETAGLFKRIKRVKVTNTSAGVARLNITGKVTYDSSNPQIIRMWKLVNEGKLADAAELFQKLPSILSPGILTFFVEPAVFVDKKKKDSREAPVVIGLKTCLPSVEGNVTLKQSDTFELENNQFRFRTTRDAPWVEWTRAKRLKDKSWSSLKARFQFPEYDIELEKAVEYRDSADLLYSLALQQKEFSKLMELLRQAAEAGSKKAMEELKNLKKSLADTVILQFSSLIESLEAPLKIAITNNFADSLNITLDLSENSFIELDETEVEFPELQKGQKIAKTLTVTPKYAGKFDFKIKIKAVVNGIELEAEKVIPVEVKEKATTPPVQSSTPAALAYTPAQFTPSPTTPKTFPPELAELYTDVEFIGKGGFARVFKAKRKQDGKVVAIKIPISLDSATGKSFLREIENWTKLKHPNIVRVYDYNILPIPFFEMEYCEDSLENLLRRRGYLPPMEAAGIIFDIAEGLKYAHSLRIIHRDLKPSNILLKQGIPKISDWGLSKVLKESRSSTFASLTPHYAAPEQISKSKFGSTDERTDIWQLGVIFYQLVTGKLPFEGEDFIEVSSSIVYETPERPSEINPDAEPLDDIIMRCLAKRKEERYESTAELQGELALLLGMEYRRNLKKSAGAGDLSRSAYYAGELLLVNLKVGDLTGAYKYAGDLAHYARGNVVEEIIALKEQIKLRLEGGLDIPPELVEKADVIVHKVKLGWRDV